MSNILYMAISEDGYIADADDNTPWSDEEWNAFREFVLSCDAILLGRRTFQIMKKNQEFIDGPKYIIVTSSKVLLDANFPQISINTLADIPKVNKLGIIGGGELNGRLATLGAIDEIILDIEAIQLYTGTRLFGKYDIKPKLELINSRELGTGTVQKRYKIIK